MKILLPLGGDDFGTFFKNLYFRLLKDKEPIMTSVNGITAILFSDDSGLEHARYENVPYLRSTNLDAVKAYYLREVEMKDPSDFTVVEKDEEKYKKNIRELREKEKLIRNYIKGLEWSDRNNIPRTDIIDHLTSILEYVEPKET